MDKNSGRQSEQPQRKSGGVAVLLRVLFWLSVVCAAIPASFVVICLVVGMMDGQTADAIRYVLPYVVAIVLLGGLAAAFRIAERFV